MVEVALSLHSLTRVLGAVDLLDEIHGEGDVLVHGVAQDSRDVTPGDVFLAWQGAECDAHDFVLDAERAGAVAAVVERIVAGVEIPQLRVRDGRRAAALIADAVMG